MSINVSYVSGGAIGLSMFTFPGGEVHVKLTGEIRHSPVIIRALIKDSNEIMSILLLTDALRRAYTGKGTLEIELDIPYVPYARQDRVMVPGEPLSIKVFADLINSQNYSKVVIWDPHSDVTPALINNCQVVSQSVLLANNLPFNETHHNLGVSWDRVKNIKESFVENTILVSPDAGANKKIGESAKLIGFKQVVRADKVRDPATGNILETVVYSEHVGDKNFLIVDDICDGARTFLELAKVLRPLTNGKIILYVTHGIFSKGLGVFKEIIDEVYCAHSFGQHAHGVNLVELKDV